MTPRAISDAIIREPPLLREDDTVLEAVRRVLESELPALPVVDADGGYRGIFGEREFMEALFPGYLKQLKGAAFLTRSLDDAIEKRESARTEPVGRYMNTEHVDVDEDFADTQLAEIFLHHRGLVIPVVQGERVVALVTRRDFFRALGERFVAR